MSPGTAAIAKADLRPAFRIRRRRAMVHAQAPLQQAALAELGPQLGGGRHLGLYWPIGSEPDLRCLQAITGSGAPAALALPAVRPGREGLELVYLSWRPSERLEADACRIPAPAAAADRPALQPQQLALLLVPALAFEPGRGIRLGSGGGWYDRLRADPAWAAVPAVAVLPACCVVPRLPSDPWDVPLDGWLCETGLHWRPR